jgi:hypothetical protein
LGKSHGYKVFSLKFLVSRGEEEEFTAKAQRSQRDAERGGGGVKAEMLNAL